MWDLPGPGIEPVSPALVGGFLTTAPPGESLSNCLVVVELIESRSQQGGAYRKEQPATQGPVYSSESLGISLPFAKHDSALPIKCTLIFVVLTVWKQLQISMAFSNVCPGTKVNPRHLQGCAWREWSSKRVCPAGSWHWSFSVMLFCSLFWFFPDLGFHRLVQLKKDWSHT